jgi:protein KTI12
MAVVIICGQPCSGKSTAAACLTKALEKASNMPVILIDEPSLNLDRNSAYQGLSPLLSMILTRALEC